MDMPTEYENSEQFLGALHTEYTSLQSARGLVNTEISSRVSSYFTILSSIMISSAFLSQLSIDDEIFAVFINIAVPSVLLIGLVTLGKIIQLAMTDIGYLKAINRIRNKYNTLFPEFSEIYLHPPFDDRESIGQLGGYSTNFLGNMMSSGSLVTLVNSIVAALYFGLMLKDAIDFQVVYYLFLVPLIFVIQNLIAVKIAQAGIGKELFEVRVPKTKSNS